MPRHFRVFLRRTYGGLPGLTWLVCAAAFINRAGAMVLPFLSLYLGKRFGYTVEEAGYVVALYGVGSVVGSLAGGRLADRFGPVRTQIGTLLVTAAWMGLLALVTAPLPLAVGVFVLGAMNDAFRPGNVAAVAASCAPFRRTKALALNRIALNAGWAIGPAVGGMLAHLDYRLLFVADGLTCALAALLLWRFVPRTLRPRAEEVRGGGGLPAGEPRSPWTDGRFLLLLALSVLCFTAFLQHFQTVSRHLQGVLGFDEQAIGRLLILNPALVIVLEMPVVQALRHRAHLPIVALGALGTGLAYPLLILQGWGSTAVVLSILVLTAGEMLSMPFLGAYVADRAPPAARGAYLGAYFASFSIAFVLAPALGGRVYDRLGADALWLGCLGAGVVAALGFWWLHQREAEAATMRPPATPRRPGPP